MQQRRATNTKQRTTNTFKVLTDISIFKIFKLQQAQAIVLYNTKHATSRPKETNKCFCQQTVWIKWKKTTQGKNAQMKAGLSATTKILHLWHLCMFFSTHQGPHAISMGLVSKAWHSDGISEKNVCPKALIVSWLCRCLTVVKINIYCITSTDHTDSGTKLPPKLLPQNNWINCHLYKFSLNMVTIRNPPKKKLQKLNQHSFNVKFVWYGSMFVSYQAQ